MKPKKMRAEMARRFPGQTVNSASTGVGCSAVQLTGPTRGRLAIMYQTPESELTPDQVECKFRDWLEKESKAPLNAV